MTAHEIHALSGAYAVDAVDDIERARFEAHLSACAECQAEVASLREATSTIGSLTEAKPSDQLRESVLAEIRSVRPLPPVAVKVLDSAPVRHRWRGLVAAAAVLSVLGAGTAVWQQTHQSAQLAQLTATDQVLKARDAQHVTVDLPRGASASVIRSLSQRKAVLVTRNLPAPPPGRIYQLWLQNGAGKMIPAGFLATGGSQTVLLSGDASQAAGVGVTVEPKGGSTSPSTAPVALLSFEKAT